MLVAKPYIQALLLACFLLCNSVFAQYFAPIKYDEENGLPSNLVYSIIQDSLGYIWMATEKGVVKYDGYDIKVFTTKDGLPSDDIWKISEDNLGNKWLHTNYSKVLGFIKGNNFKVAYRDTSALRCYNLFHIGSKTYFENVTGNGHNGVMEVMMYEPQIDSVTKHRIEIGIKATQALAVTSDLKIFKIDKDGRVGVVNNVFLDSSQYNVLCDSFFDFYGTMHIAKLLFPVVDDTYVVFSFQGKSIDVVKPYDCLYKKISIKSFGCSDDEYLVLIYYRHDRDDYVLITNKQLISLNKDFTIKEKLLSPSEYDKLNASICYLTESKGHSKWYSTTTSGALCIPGPSVVFEHNKMLDVLQNAKLSSHPGRRTTYWYNVDRAKLYRVSDGSLQDSVQLPFGSYACYVSEHTNSPRVSISTSNEFYFYNLDTRELSAITKGKKVSYNNVLLPDNTKYMAVKGTKHHWHDDSTLYTSKLGFVINRIYSDSVDVQTNVLKVEHPLKGHYYDATRKLYWLYNSSDLICHSPEKSIQYRFAGLHELFGTTSINSVDGDSYGNIYVYNSDELFLVQPELGFIRKLNKGFSMLNGGFVISGNTIVLAGDFGIAYAEIKDKCIVSEFSVIPNTKKFAYKSVNGVTLYNNVVTIVTTSGTYNINLDGDDITSVGKSISDSSFMSLLLEKPYEHKLNGASTDTLYVTQDLQFIKLNLLNLSGRGTVQYKYSLNAEGWNSNMSGEIFIGNLKPGVPHKLKCKARDDIWETKTYTLFVYRAPSWYQTRAWVITFWVAGISVFIVLILLTISITKSIADRNAEKKQQMTDLQLRAIYSQINPHFIFNSLASALYFIDNKKFDDAYNHVSKFSKLLRGYLKSSQERFVVLEDEIKMLKNYIELQQTRFEEKFEYSIIVDNKIPAQSIMIPSLLLQPIVENAINHGLFHMVEKGRLDIVFKQGDDSDELICKIEDNGVGREKATQIKKDSSNRKESYGTHLTEKLMEIFKDYEHMNISMQYIDKQLPEQGTVVILSIKNLKYVV